MVVALWGPFMMHALQGWRSVLRRANVVMTCGRASEHTPAYSGQGAGCALLGSALAYSQCVCACECVRVYVCLCVYAGINACHDAWPMGAGWMPSPLCPCGPHRTHVMRLTERGGWCALSL